MLSLSFIFWDSFLYLQDTSLSLSLSLSFTFFSGMLSHSLSLFFRDFFLSLQDISLSLSFPYISFAIYHL